MAGHSKWHNIQRRKGAQDVKRGKIFMYHAKNIYTVAKVNGDPVTNPALRLAIEKARDDNMPNDNIERAIKKATGTLEGASYEEVTYEGYGPDGIAIIIHALTDNRNRTAAEIRHAFSKNGGNLGETGCVSFMFDRIGCIIILNEDEKIDEDELTLTAIDVGAEDIEYEDGVFEVNTTPKDLHKIMNDLKGEAFEIESSEITLVPQTYTDVSEESRESMFRLIEQLEELEDVQDIHHNMKETD